MHAHDVPENNLLEQEAVAAIRELLLNRRPLLLAYSGGKDSTVVLVLALNAAFALKAEGFPVPAILVTHGDTGIENPTVSQLARREMAKALEFAAKHGLTVRAEVAHPALNDTWAVSILSGRKLPTFANSTSRDCTIAYKIKPMVRLRKQLLTRHEEDAEPVTLIGTRFEESNGRAARMAGRGETALVPWEKDGAWFLSPIANWTSDDVWEFIGRMRAGNLPAFTDGADVFELYASAGGTTCAVVSDMATEGAKKSRACGARFGCSLCAAVGRDKSLENMLEVDPSYAWLRGVNRIQRFLVATQYDFDRRNWLGRSIDDMGYLTVRPDTYSPAMLAELLRYCLSVDADEKVAASQAGLQPRFELVSEQQLIAIDAFWALHGLQDRAFEAVRIWRYVHEQGARFYPPDNMATFPPKPLPSARYLHVGPSWDGTPQRYTGLRDVLREMAPFEGSPNRVLKNGHEVLALEESALFEVSEEGASLFMAFEAERYVRDQPGQPSSLRRVFFTYAGLGTLSTSARHTATLDELTRRTSWKRREGLTGNIDRKALLARTVSEAERVLVAPEELVGPPERLTARERLCHPAYL